VRGARAELGEPVVLADQHDREPPQGREVHRLGERARLHRPVAEEDDRHGVLAADPGGERAAQRHRHGPTDDPGGAEHPVRDVDQVHRATHAPAQAAVAAHQLGHRLRQRCTLGDHVAVRAVAAVDDVAVPQLPAHRRGHALAADGQVDQSVHLVGALEPPDPLLERADPPHRAQHRPRLVCVHATLRTAATILSSSGST
jgi:hypothetical protein